ncbi:MAG TPA: glycerophosphodiester phosphodiesterase family protein [Marmoricola sp.]
MISVRTFVATTVAVAGCLTSAALAAPAHASTAGNFSLVGHRGYPQRTYTENTFRSFENALRNGAPAVETDIRLTKDKHFVVMHDQYLRRTTNCDAAVDASTLSWIQSHCHGKRHHEFIPDLTRLLAWAADHDTNVIVELKQDPLHRWTSADLQRIDTLVDDAGMTSRVHLLSFSTDLLRLAEGVDPHLFTDWIVGKAAPWTRVESVATWADSVSVLPASLTAAEVEELHAGGVLAYARVADRIAAWRHLKEIGADGLLTDDVSGYRSWASS